ncbi:hypothetical protein BCR32DRAFT_325974 [Anaeromyces robustus]|uniref:SCP domain-containing protein n=1 Tax=Anaeromyces robustus TaxID=1754192 RepID=A0A1Y1XG12_9FUNG|nr:hypothetical protein BCR32DRAFT_325974 [Anaeromyces robustus]|eukprot:ORX84314.1 hypothetical protein BCR32DRAFT_325974 [Anaeromyces robustus]
MQPLYWSSSLASDAQEYAEECHGLVHSGVMGENLATATYHDVGRLYKLWEKERNLFESSDSNRKKYPGSHSYGHYTQIVWAANTKVGCGLAYCSNLSQPYNLVCRYEIGNIIGYPVYSFTSTTVERPNVISKKTTTKGSSSNTGGSQPTSTPEGGNSNGDGGANGDTNGGTNGGTNGDGNNDPAGNKNNPNDNSENSIGNGVDVEAKDDGNGGIILVVVGSTAASGAAALLYVKKKKPEKYQKMCRQISMQQRELTKMTKKLGHSTSTIGRKIIERSRTSATLGRHIKAPHVFKRNKSNNDVFNAINIQLSDDLDCPYRFNMNNYDDFTTGKKSNSNDFTSNYYNNSLNFYNNNKEPKKSLFGFATFKRKSYRKLSTSSVNDPLSKYNKEYPSSRKATPVPKYSLDIIEKMNNLDKYEQFITQSKTSSSTDYSENRPILKAYQSPIMRDRKGSDSTIDYRGERRYSNRSSNYSYSNSNNSETALLSSNRKYSTDNDYDHEYYEYDNQGKVTIVDPDLRPPLPIRYKQGGATRNRSLSQNSGVVFPQRKRSLSRGRSNLHETHGSLSRNGSLTRNGSLSRSGSLTRNGSLSRSNSRGRTLPPSTPTQKAMPSPHIGPQRLQRNHSLNGRKPRPGHEPGRGYNHQRSQSSSSTLKRTFSSSSRNLDDIFDSYH